MSSKEELYLRAGGAAVKKMPDNAGDPRDTGLIPGLRKSLGIRKGHPVQYSCLENFMDRGAWWATVHGVTKASDMTELAPMCPFYSSLFDIIIFDLSMTFA